MSKKSKILIWIVGSVVGLMLVAVLALKIFFPLEDVKAMAIEKGEAALGRPLTVETIDISIWGGLGVKLGKVAIGSPAEFGDLKLLEARAVDIKLELWELIKGNYVVDRLIINSPTVHLRKLADGTNNYTFEFDTTGLDSEAAREAAEKLKDATPEQKAAATVVAFDRLEINNGTFSYQDDSTGNSFEARPLVLTTALEMPREGIYRSTGRLSVDTLRLSAIADLPELNLKLAYEFEYDLPNDQLAVSEAKLSVNGLEMNLEGLVKSLAGQTEGQLRVKSDDLSLAQLIDALPVEQKRQFDEISIVGLAAVEANVDWQTVGDSLQLDYVGSAQLRDLSVTSSLTSGELLITRTAVDFKNDQVRLTLNEAAFDSRPLKGFLSIENFEEPIVNAELAGAADLAFLAPFMPPELTQEISGLAEFDMTISGPVSRPEKMNYVGQLKVENGSYVSPLLPEPVESFDLSISLAPQAIRLEKFRVQFLSSDITITGRINNPFPYLLPFDIENRGQAVQPDAELTVTSHKLNVDKLFPEAVPGSGAIKTSGGEVIVDSVKMIPLPDIIATGTIALDTVIYAEVEFTDIKGKLDVQERKVRIYEVSGLVYSGQVSGETTVDLADFNNPHYTGAFKATQIEANDFLSRFSKMGGYLFGKVDVDGTYNASGWEPEAFANSLTMNSVGSLDEGQLKTSDATKQILSSLAERTGQTFSDDQTLKKLWTNIRVENGRIHLDDLKSALGNIGDITLGGSTGFDGTIDFTGGILLTEVMTSKMASQGGVIGQIVSRMTSGDNRRLSVPVIADGTTDNPSVRLDFDAILENLNINLNDEAKNLLKGLFR